MQNQSSMDILENYLRWWDGHTLEVGQLHDRFLELRRIELLLLVGSIERQLASGDRLRTSPARFLFSLDDLKEFATGSVMKCLGQEYAIYAGRRSLRIPNGELLLMSRIQSIRGRKGEFEQTSSILAEYDVPQDAWYFEGEKGGRLPYSICIEIALQPCGFLSAYLGTPLRFPEIDYSFRNLDGESVFHRMVDARGKTIRARANLLKTIFYGETIIQHFSFELLCDGEVFFEGKSSFGYFSAEAMSSQNGLDGGKTILPVLKLTDQTSQIVSLKGTALETGLPEGKLRLVDGVIIQQVSDKKQEGAIYASRRNTPQDWFYACHFHEDPVMPGSLGIEAIIQAMKVYARLDIRNSKAPELVAGQIMKWSYRGQVLQHHRQMQLEVHFHKTVRNGKYSLFTGDASLWADDSRIYEVKNLAISLEEVKD